MYQAHKQEANASFARRAFLASPAIVLNELFAAESAPPAKDADWLLVHIDTETTGLNPAYHELIDIGVVYTDRAGKELGRWFQRLMPKHPERLDPGAQAVNGFDAALWKQWKALPPGEALADWIAYDSKTFGKRPRVRLAYNCAFDKGFLDALYRAEGKEWSEDFTYFWLDIPSMAWALGYRQLRGTWVAEALGVEDEPHGGVQHTGLTGAEVNVRIYRELLRRHKI
jgi:DNA polymerase III epsilon subunit-like protein